MTDPVPIIYQRDGRIEVTMAEFTLPPGDEIGEIIEVMESMVLTRPIGSGLFSHDFTPLNASSKPIFRRLSEGL